MWWILLASTWAADPAQRVEIEVRCGDVHVTGGSKRVEVNGEGVSVEPGVKTEIHDAGRGCVEIDVHMPSDMRLDIETISADASVEGVSGRLEFESVSGDLDIIAGASQPSVVRAESVSGDLQIHVGKGAEVDLETVSGRILVHGGPVAKVEVATMSGDVTVAAGARADAEIEIEAHSSRVLLQLDPPPATVDFDTFSGRLRADLPGFHDDYGRGDVHHDVGRGPRVEVETFSGDVRLQPLPEE